MIVTHTYRIHSTPAVYAPGVIRWLQNGLLGRRDRKVMMEVLGSCGFPEGFPHLKKVADRVRQGQYGVEGDTVTITIRVRVREPKTT